MSCTEPYIHWISHVFGQCVSGPRQITGFCCGLLSTLIWMYAEIPQVVMNFKRHSADGLSLAFLTFMVTADICSLLGAIMTGGLATQIISATWFIIVDGTCWLQCFYYQIIKRKSSEVPISDSSQKMSALPLLLAATTCTGYKPYEPPALYGSILGWISAVGYTSSRLPQIIKNFKRKKTDGLSIQFFICAVLGNTTYALSIFLADTHWDWIWSQFPWLIGSIGLLPFDFTVLGQFLVYGKEEMV